MKKRDGEGQDDDRKMAFHVAVQYGHLDIVKYLWEGQWCDVNKKKESAEGMVALAAEYGHGDVVEYLLNQEVAVKEDAYTALYVAICKKKDAVVLSLLNRGIHKGIGDEDGKYASSPCLSAFVRGYD